MEMNKTICFLLVLLFFAISVASSMAATVTTALETDESVDSSPLRRFLTQYNPRAAMTCDQNPKVCHQKGSPGHECCKKRCVDLKTDNLHCGQCGRKCKYGEVCCNSKCVNILYDRNNCGGCHKKCKKGSYCRYGMCSYA